MPHFIVGHRLTFGVVRRDMPSNSLADVFSPLPHAL
jgi:hypothetical protein